MTIKFGFSSPGKDVQKVRISRQEKLFVQLKSIILLDNDCLEAVSHYISICIIADNKINVNDIRLRRMIYSLCEHDILLLCRNMI